MRIPIYEELIIEDFSLIALKQTLAQYKVGLIPMYTSFHTLSPKERAAAALNIETVLIELDTHPLFPYPFYIVSETPIKGISISIFSKVQDLPSHYFKKVKRLKPKELQLLSKVSLLSEKVINNDLYRKDIILAEGNNNQLLLYRTTKELSFYEKILENLDEQEK